MKQHPKKAGKAGVEMTWLGHSAFMLKSPDGKVILVDPWLDNPKAPRSAKEIAHVDLILISHGHSDHVGNTIEIARRTTAKVICIHEVSLYLQSKGVARVQGMNKGGTIVVDGIAITMVDARHSGAIDAESPALPGGEAAGFVIRFGNGFTIYYSGDTALFGDMKLVAQLYKPALVILPIGGVYTMAPKEAALACLMLKPKQVVGVHYGTFPALTGTPDELRKHLPPPLRKKVLELEPGRALAL